MRLLACSHLLSFETTHCWALTLTFPRFFFSAHLPLNLFGICSIRWSEIRIRDSFKSLSQQCNVVGIFLQLLHWRYSLSPIFYIRRKAQVSKLVWLESTCTNWQIEQLTSIYISLECLPLSRASRSQSAPKPIFYQFPVSIHFSRDYHLFPAINKSAVQKYAYPLVLAFGRDGVCDSKTSTAEMLFTPFNRVWQVVQISLSSPFLSSAMGKANSFYEKCNWTKKKDSQSSGNARSQTTRPKNKDAVKPRDNDNPTPDKSEKKRRKRAAKPKEPPMRLKVVVRRLPPNLPEELFWKSVEQWREFVDWSSYLPGKLAQRYVDNKKHEILCRRSIEINIYMRFFLYTFT